MAGHSQPRVSPMYWDLLNQNWESEPGCWLFMTHESVLSSVHCFVHLTPHLPSVTSWLVNGQAVSSPLTIVRGSMQSMQYFSFYEKWKVQVYPIMDKMSRYVRFILKYRIVILQLEQKYQPVCWIPTTHVVGGLKKSDWSDTIIWPVVARKWLFAKITLRWPVQGTDEAFLWLTEGQMDNFCIWVVWLPVWR